MFSKSLQQISHYLWLVTNLHEIVYAESYYPELPRKTILQRYFENIRYCREDGRLNDFYNLYGLDIVGTNPDDYFAYETFKKSRDEKNQFKKVGDGSYSHIALVRDKFLFSQYMKSIGGPTPAVFAVIMDGRFFNSDFTPITDVDAFFREHKSDFFIKNFDSLGGHGVQYIRDFDELNKHLSFYAKGLFILQDKIQQHHEMNRLNPHSINTVRMVTVRGENGPHLWNTFCRIGTARSGFVDNVSSGGMAVGIDDEGKLMKFGFCEPGAGTKVTVHPDSGVTFESFEIPRFKEAMNLVLSLHRKMYMFHSIGWDVVITETGVTILEANDNWGGFISQACFGGLRSKWEKSLQY